MVSWVNEGKQIRRTIKNADECHRKLFSVFCIMENQASDWYLVVIMGLCNREKREKRKALDCVKWADAFLFGLRGESQSIEGKKLGTFLFFLYKSTLTNFTGTQRNVRSCLMPFLWISTTLKSVFSVMVASWDLTFLLYVRLYVHN